MNGQFTLKTDKCSPISHPTVVTCHRGGAVNTTLTGGRSVVSMPRNTNVVKCGMTPTDLSIKEHLMLNVGYARMMMTLWKLLGY